VESCCECGNEVSNFIKYEEFLGYLRTSYLLKKYSAPWSSFVGS
jgi:hypothetical protein